MMGDVNKRAARLILPLALLCAAGLLLMPLPDRWSRGWRATLLDLGHVPLFGLLALLTVRRGRSVVWPLVFVVGLAGLVEVAQGAVGRTVSRKDFAYGALGATAAVVGLLAWRHRQNTARAIGGGVLVVGLLAWPVFDAAPPLIDAYQGYRAFPILADFRTQRELLRWHCDQAELTRITDPELPGAWVARLNFHPGPHPYPGAWLEPVTTDFRTHRWLCCSFVVEGGPLELVISVRSRARETGGTTHFQVERRYERGPHLVRLDLVELGRQAKPHPLDRSDMRAVQFFIVELQEPRTILLRRVWLEP